MRKIIMAFFFFIFLCWTYAAIDIAFFSPNCNQFAVLGAFETTRPIAVLIYFVLAIMSLVSVNTTNKIGKKGDS
ncbi:hypothetical protein [Mongoliitalea lutea]|uniref:Uncharacterized protein n=1 Tax=Mongoliitalea lutea TaxID=849756 RepID=A0A8J3G5N2_9BACT|nr:hypothetical protein [Mongoliitalea lutea]GHB37424.1 hypothetical protein GCM10008106_18300 [Mongoliitalea lutea]